MYKFTCIAYPDLIIVGNPDIQFRNGEFKTDDEDLIERIDKASTVIHIIKEKMEGSSASSKKVMNNGKGK